MSIAVSSLPPTPSFGHIPAGGAVPVVVYRDGFSSRLHAQR